MTDNNFEKIPGYKQPWLWFVLTPLIVVFFVGVFMLYVATVSNDGVVVDNYYKDGLGIKVRNQQDERANDLGLNAKLNLFDNKITLVLNGDLENKPQQLSLQIVHPTQDDFDINLTLTRAGYQYHGAVNQEVVGRRIIQLSPVNSDFMWRLHGDFTFPLNEPLSLKPKNI